MKYYFDCGAGVAGDMILGALVDLGLSPRELERALRKAIPMTGWRLEVGHTERKSWPARSVKVRGDRPFGSPEKMKTAIRKASLPDAVKTRAIKALNLLEWAEAQAHGVSKGQFDDQGLALLDTLVDILGTSWGFWKLGIDSATASPVNTGRIAPATGRIIARQRIPVYSTSNTHELATPTGIAILCGVAGNFGAMAALQLEKAGYGAGAADFPDHPNVLAICRYSAVRRGTWTEEPVLLLETVIDDMDPRLYPHVTDLLMKAGALDVWWSPVGMKKGRPGIAFSVLCHLEEEQALLRILFHETTTLGVRRLPLERYILPRESKGLLKTAILSKGQVKKQVEFELARKKAQHLSIPLRKLLK